MRHEGQKIIPLPAVGGRILPVVGVGLVWSPVVSLGFIVAVRYFDPGWGKTVNPKLFVVLLATWALGTAAAGLHAIVASEVDNLWVPLLALVVVVPSVATLWNGAGWSPLFIWMAALLALPVYWIWNLFGPWRGTHRPPTPDSATDPPTPDSPELREPWD